MLDFKAPCTHTFSANEIRVESECSRKRYYASRDHLALRANRPAKALMLGSAVHAFLAYHYTELQKFYDAYLQENGTAPDVDTLLDAMDDLPKYENPDLEQLDPDTRKVYDCVTSMNYYYIADDVTKYEILSCETPFQMEHWPIEDVVYHGFIDMEVRSRENGKIYFFEHKTCANFRPDIYDRFDIQLHLYAAYGKKQYGDEFGGMILNQMKKAKTFKGYDSKRATFEYNEAEMSDFITWLKAKTVAAISPDNTHAPCNNYMTCKMCEYAPICLKYGYQLPETTDEVISQFDDVDPITGECTPTYKYDPRTTEEEAE